MSTYEEFMIILAVAGLIVAITENLPLAAFLHTKALKLYAEEIAPPLSEVLS